MYAEWRFVPRQLVDVSHRTLEIPILDRAATMPLVLAPSRLNGLSRRGGDLMLAQDSATAGVPFT